MSRVAIILGSNCESVSDRMEVEKVIPYEEISGFPQAPVKVPGHALEVLVGSLDGTEALCYSGRYHRYQGISAYDVAALVRHAYHAGCDTLIITTGAAALTDELSAGSLMAVTDQVDLTGESPLVGPTMLFPDDVPFVDMCGAYDPQLIDIACQVAKKAGIALAQGVAACTVGPQYLTRAEAGVLRRLGCSTVTLSLAAEVIQARALGMRVLGLCNITSHAGAPSNHRSTDEMLDQTKADLGLLVSGVLARLAGGAASR